MFDSRWSSLAGRLRQAEIVDSWFFAFCRVPTRSAVVGDTIKITSRSITAQVKQEGTFLVVGASETAMLYEIKEENGKFNLYFSKKKGLKFKKSFDELRWAEWFVERYLAHCCISCQQRGWVYKARGFRRITPTTRSKQRFKAIVSAACR